MSNLMFIFLVPSHSPLYFPFTNQQSLDKFMMNTLGFEWTSNVSLYCPAEKTVGRSLQIKPMDNMLKMELNCLNNKRKGVFGGI